VAYGLLYQADDMARLGLYLQRSDTMQQLLGPDDYDRIMFRSGPPGNRWQMSRGEAYAAGFWGFDIAPYAGCDQPVWIPFMSGYGGIIWALLPNGLVYYHVNDGGHASWMDAVLESAKLTAICPPPGAL
jgi:hypothetical protein